MSIGEQLYVQVIGVVATGLYAAIASFVLLKLVGVLLGLRVSTDEET